MSKWYGSINNRLDENKMFCDEIEVGTGMTEYSWSDRQAYEVIAVQDQKHVTVRRLDHKHVGEPYSNEWELTSNPDNPTYTMIKRGNYWYSVQTVTAEMIDRDLTPEERINLAINGFDPEIIRAKGKQSKYTRRNVSFGVAEYYYDYEF